MKDIAIYGAGGLGREIACMIKSLNEKDGQDWNLIGFFDDGKPIGEQISHLGKVLGGLSELNKWSTMLNVVLCFGSPVTLAIVRSKISNPNINFPNIIASDFSIADNSTFNIGHGNIITSQCAVTTNISIGNFNLLNGSVVFGHDVKIGNFNVFMPGVRVSGEVKIGNKCQFGSGSFIKQVLEIPDNVTLSPLSALLTRPKAASLYIGNPAKRIRF